MDTGSGPDSHLQVAFARRSASRTHLHIQTRNDKRKHFASVVRPECNEHVQTLEDTARV